MTRSGRVDEARVDGGQVVVADPPSVHRAGCEVRDDHIGGLDKAMHDLDTCGFAGIDGDRALPPIAGDVVGRPPVVARQHHPPRLIADVGKLDLDHIGSHVAEHARGLGALDQQPDVDHP
jgi:hypothetical protein